MRFIKGLPGIILIISAYACVGQSASLQSGTTQIGNFIFKMPVGWKRIDQNGGVVLAPKDQSDAPPYVIALFDGGELNTDFRSWFDLFLKTASKHVKVLKRDEISSTKDDEYGFDVLYTTEAVKDRDGAVSVRFYLAANPGSRVDAIACIAIDADSYKKYQPVQDRFIKGLEFANVKTTARAPKSNGRTPNADGDSGGSLSSGISDLYVANILESRMNPFNSTFQNLSYNLFWVLTPNGRVYFAAPQGDPRRFDFNSICQTTPNNCSTYQSTGGLIKFTFRGKEVSFRKGQDVVQIGRVVSGQNSGTTVFRKIDAGNIRLEGRFGRSNFVNTSGGGSSGSVSSDTVYEFSGDGRFAVVGFVGFASTSGGTGAAGSRGRQGQGTYRVSNNILELNFSDGRREQVFFFRAPGEEEKVISINGVNYLRR